LIEPMFGGQLYETDTQIKGEEDLLKTTDR
jgi:hypothetical protein